MKHSEFQKLLRKKGEGQWRDMPWRRDSRPYYVLVSELMLQQTQVGRVIPKFEAFIARFPDEESLASAELAEVLKLWQGLGYNRRAKYLHESARMIINRFDGVFPRTEKELLELPGVGKNTAGAILAYAFNQPSIFVETNIRTVYIHHFFEGQQDVTDADIIKKLTKTLDYKNPRRFYQNLMDYGAYLKISGVRNISKSKHYIKQSPLEGSLRQMRGMILKALAHADLDESELCHRFVGDDRLETALSGLERDGLVERTSAVVRLTK